MYKKIPDRENLYARAAILAAEDELSDTEIANLCGITRRTLVRWKKQPTIRKKIDEHLGLIQQHSEVQMVSERQNRIADMDLRWRQLQDIIRERANSPEMRSVPGGSTGLLRCYNVVPSHTGGGSVANYKLDRGLLREIRRLEMAAAKAVGEWQTPKYRPTAFPKGPSQLSGKQHRAAMLVADGTRSDLEIAPACGINRRTLARRKEQISFGTRVAEVRTTVFQ